MIILATPQTQTVIKGMTCKRSLELVTTNDFGGFAVDSVTDYGPSYGRVIERVTEISPNDTIARVLASISDALSGDALGASLLLAFTTWLQLFDGLTPKDRARATSLASVGADHPAYIGR